MVPDHRGLQSVLLGAGVVIASLQRTQADGRAALRFYGRLETMLSEVQLRMKLRLDTKTYEPPLIPEPRRSAPAAAQRGRSSSRSPPKK